MPLEEAARQQIDASLVSCGWVVQDTRQINLGTGPGVAVREVSLVSGRADYLLFVDRRPVGVVEANKAGTTLSTVAEQSGFYAENLPAALRGQLPAGPLPFLYESTGVETFFRDERDPHPRSRRVFVFHRPATPSAPGWPAAALRAPACHHRHARLSDRSHHRPGAILRRGPPPRLGPNGHRRGQDLHRPRGDLPAHRAPEELEGSR